MPQRRRQAPWEGHSFLVASRPNGRRTTPGGNVVNGNRVNKLTLILKGEVWGSDEGVNRVQRNPHKGPISNQTSFTKHRRRKQPKKKTLWTVEWSYTAGL